MSPRGTRTPIVYCARFISGLEDIVQAEIESRVPCSDIKLQHRSLFFSSSCPPNDLLQLKSVDDIFMVLGTFSAIPSQRNALALIHEQAIAIDYPHARSTLATIRQINHAKGFSITASFVGKRNYNRWEIAASVRPLIENALQMHYLDAHGQSLPDHDIHLRVHLEHSSGWIGIRLSHHPLSKRSYKTSHIKGSLAPTLAFAMLRLANLSATQVLLDPMSGAGTIVLEADQASNGVAAIGMDISRAAISASIANKNNSSLDQLFLQSDARLLPIAPNSIDAIVSDLPWGKQTELQNADSIEIKLDYVALLSECARVLTNTGIMVLLTLHENLLAEAAAQTSLEITHQRTISLYGQQPQLFILRK